MHRECGNALFAAVVALASSPRTMQERLAQAYDAGLAALLRVAEPPETIRQELMELKAQFGRMVPGAPAMAEDIRAALLRIDGPTAQRLAQRVVYLYREWASGRQA